MSQKLLSMQEVLVRFKPSLVALTTRIGHCQSAARAHFTNHVPEHVSKECTATYQPLSNNDHQNLLTTLICSWADRHYHLDCNSQVSLNTIDTMKVQTIALNTE